RSVDCEGGLTVVDDHDDPQLQSHELAPLIPALSDLGPGWEQFSLQLMSKITLIDPATEDQAQLCGLAELVVVRDGLYAEYGFGQSPDDALLLISRGTTSEIEVFYEGMRTVTQCMGEEEGAVYEVKKAPEIPSALGRLRFSLDDELGQHREGLLVLREDVVYYLSISDVDAAWPVDLNRLAMQLFADYDR
ncbi:MAG: hypothetical protein GY773_21220, partial [Actinomycetia bacterium]|nr:hypothetical protein [Actinomycetes bacterium]